MTQYYDRKGRKIFYEGPGRSYKPLTDSDPIKTIIDSVNSIVSVGLDGQIDKDKTNHLRNCFMARKARQIEIIGEETFIREIDTIDGLVTINYVRKAK